MNYAMMNVCRVADTLPVEQLIHLSYGDVKQVAFQLGRRTVRVTDEMIRDELIKRCNSVQEDN